MSRPCLSPAQIQYLRIGPKTSNCNESKKAIISALEQQYGTEGSEVTQGDGLNKIPKFTYGSFEKTVNNFGVLINKNFGEETMVHQAQKFGTMVNSIHTIMIEEKDRPIINEKKQMLMKKIKERSDIRVMLKAVQNYKGSKISITLYSFKLESTTEQKATEILPLPYLKFLINHVNSYRLVKIIENSIKAQGNQITIDFDKIENKAEEYINSQKSYQRIEYNIQRMGQQLTIQLPQLEFKCLENQYEQKCYIQNKEILAIMDTNFENVNDIFDKYFDEELFAKQQKIYSQKQISNKEIESAKNIQQVVREEQEEEEPNGQRQQVQDKQIQQKEKQFQEQEIKEKQQNLSQNEENLQRQAKLQKSQKSNEQNRAQKKEEGQSKEIEVEFKQVENKDQEAQNEHQTEQKQQQQISKQAQDETTLKQRYDYDIKVQ